MYDNVSPLLCAVMISACRKEKIDAMSMNLFPDLTSTGIDSLHDVLNTLKNASKKVSLCFNIALLELLIESLQDQKLFSSLSSHIYHINGNISQLLSYSKFAENYISKDLLSNFYSIRSSTESNVNIVHIARHEQQKYKTKA